MQQVAAMLILIGGCSDAPSRPQPTQEPSDVLVPGEGALVFVDRQTNSSFNLRGEAFAGPLADQGVVLDGQPGVNMFWFAWSVFFPGSEIWGRSERVRQAELPSNKTGSAGCGGGADCIPSLPNTGTPEGALAWTDAEGATYLADDDLVLGTFYQRKSRAYPHNILWWHEIANDSIDGESYAVTFCPLTGSGVVWAGDSFGVSGNLFNSNLVMYDHRDESLWPQLWMGAVSGPRNGEWLQMLPVTETTWKAWRELHPETLVLSDDTGHSRDYQRYPYGDYRTDNSTTFRVTNPLPDPLYANKDMVFGLIDRTAGDAKGFVHRDIASNVGSRAVLNETFADQPVVIIYDQSTQLVVAFVATDGDGNALRFELAP